MADPITSVTEYLREFPGIGPRAARRIAYWLVHRERGWVEAFARAVLEARKTVVRCTRCMRLFPAGPQTQRLCAYCADGSRDPRLLLVVEKDVDLENVERTGVYKGQYFVLGGTTSPLERDPVGKVRLRELDTLLSSADAGVEEIILALSATTEGEDTVQVLREHLAPTLVTRSLKVSVLGRGLSTGTELEYVDTDTMKSALLGRS